MERKALLNVRTLTTTDLRLQIAVGIWGVVVFLAASTFFCISCALDVATAGREREIQGEVTGLGGWNHGPTYNYRYVIAGRSHFGDSSRTYGDRAYRTGQGITVYYDPKRPEKSSLMHFRDQVDWFGATMALPFAAAALIYTVISIRRFRRALPVDRNQPA